MAGLYIHIPFCASRCIYCGFFSTTHPQRQNDYVDALCREMAMRADFLAQSGREEDNAQTIRTIYIGGGTPSMLTLDNFKRIVENAEKNFDLDIEEFTVEVNPDDVTPILAKGFADLGVNRISMGVQTFNEARLQFLHRRHTNSEVFQAVDLFGSAGIANISVDLMYGFPNETIEEWECDITKALSLPVKHLSAYCLTFEKGTTLFNMMEKGTVQEIDEESELHMYNVLVERLRHAGFEHYEISNFAKTGFRSQHNSSYWNDTPYLGIGAAAHSYNRVCRQWNVSNLDKYIKDIRHNCLPMDYELIDEDTHYNDLITTTLRTSDGLSLGMLQKRFQNYILKNATRYLSSGDMELVDNVLRITRKGLFVSDMIMADLMFV